MSTTASTTSSAPHPLRILIVVASLSGNTRELARMIAVQCRQVGHQVCLHEADEVQAPWLPAADADLVLLGTWTDNAGRTPSEMKQWVAGVEHPQALAQVAVFGTGETQWGLEYYCGAVHRLRRYFNSAHPPLEIEQMPHGQRHALAINEWTAQVLAAVTPESRKGIPAMLIIDATTPEQFQQVLAEHPRLLVDFHKEQCPGCRMLELSLQRVAASEAGQGMSLLRVKLETLGEGFFKSLGLRQTPTLAVFRDGQEQARLAGFQSPQQIEAAIGKHL